MNQNKKIRFALGILLFYITASLQAQRSLQEIPFADIEMQGELYQRISKNFGRLHEEKYQPQNVFLTEEESGNWPGDTEGRTILALVLDAQASHKAPLHLKQILDQIPAHLNEKGYMGPVYEGKMNEQQVSGNGWMLRGLCEYYAWKKDPDVLPIMKTIVENLFIKGKGFYANYPIDPKSRKADVGAESGSIQNTVDDWMLSSDIGCVFIGMEGAIHAYQYLRMPELKEVIEEMITRFLEIDLVKIKAQTHASLTACRGLLRYDDITGEDKYLQEVEERWQIYKRNGMTNNHENYNWFGRFDTWTEPCAIVDSYLLAVQLWQHTGKVEYRNDAELIYYNGICHTQRFNGGFGCDNCPNGKMPYLKVHAPEAHWCCTMRGAEGLSQAVKYAYRLEQDTLFIPFFHRSELSWKKDTDKAFALQQDTHYPFGETVSLKVEKNTAGIKSLKLPILPWAFDYTISFNGKECKPNAKNGFFTLCADFHSGDIIELKFKQKLAAVPMSHAQDNDTFNKRFYYGPLLLGAKTDTPISLDEIGQLRPMENLHFKVLDRNTVLSPIYHLLDPDVWEPDYKKQILF